MPVELEITKADGVGTIEEKLTALLAKLTPHATNELHAKLASDRRATFFKDLWASMALAAGIDAASTASVVAWGLADWSGLTDPDGFALSHPSLLAMQRGAAVCTQKNPPQALNTADVRRLLLGKQGLLGADGGRFRTVVELDPEAPRAGVLSKETKPRDTFFDFVRSALHDLEIGAATSGRRASAPARSSIIEWLYELHTNGYEHARVDRSVRIFRIQKHLYPDRTKAIRHAAGMPELSHYIQSQDDKPSNGMFNLVEASVSDFGPGIIDGFLNTYVGDHYKNKPRKDLLHDILHEQLSCKGNDLSAGLGIRKALEAARSLDAYVSLRTAEFSLCMRGQIDSKPVLAFREGPFATVVGTHWQLLLPDRSNSN